MNGRFEEKLARIAFGDATPEEIAKIERKAKSDPAAAKALAEFRQLKAELRQMADTPAHQLSNERLREAILAQGLHPKPLRDPHPGLGAGWLWMPVAAAVLGIAFVNLRRHSAATEPQIFVGSPAIQANNSAKLETPSNFKVEPAGKNLVAEVDTKDMRMTTPSWVEARSAAGAMSRQGTRHRRHHAAEGDLLPSWDPTQDRSNWQAYNFGGPTSSAAAKPTTPPPVKYAEANSSPSTNSPFVIIDSNPDAQTGAPGATEVGTASNVVIGG